MRIQQLNSLSFAKTFLFRKCFACLTLLISRLYDNPSLSSHTRGRLPSLPLPAILSWTGVNTALPSNVHLVSLSLWPFRRQWPEADGAGEPVQLLVRLEQFSETELTDAGSVFSQSAENYNRSRDEFISSVSIDTANESGQAEHDTDSVGASKFLRKRTSSNSPKSVTSPASLDMTYAFRGLRVVGAQEMATLANIEVDRMLRDRLIWPTEAEYFNYNNSISGAGSRDVPRDSTRRSVYVSRSGRVILTLQPGAIKTFILDFESL